MKDVLAERITQPIREMERAIARCIGKENRKFLASGARDDVPCPRCLHEERARLTKHRIAGDVSAAVVDALEVIQIDRKERELAARP